MYEIKIKVNGNGTLNIGKAERLRLGTANEVNRCKLVFEVDSSIEGSYQYIKFLKKDTSYLYRVYDKEIVVNKSVLANPGIWLLSFISTNSGIVNNEITGTYAFISQPIEAVVYDGILEKGSMNEDAEVLKRLIELDMYELYIQDYVESIGDYFMYNTDLDIAVFVGSGVKTIGSYAFYNNLLGTLDFGENSQVETLKDYALYNIFFENDIYIPPSVKNWGKYCFKNSDATCLIFQRNSQLKALGSYALWENGFYEIYLPDHLETLSGNTYVIKNCNDLFYLWIPNTITTTIPANAIYGCPALEEIELQEGFNVSANFSNCTNLSTECLIGMLNALKDLTGQTAKSLTIGATNLAKLTNAQKGIATDKNWTLS